MIIIFPLRCFNEIVEGFCDILCLFKRISEKACAHLSAIEAALLLVKNYGPLDLVNVNVTSPNARVKVKLLLR
jgi:hypothetical protein